MHIDSQKFLCGAIVCSETNNSAYMVELSDKFG